MLTGWLVAVVALGTMRHGRVAYAEEEARLRATQEPLRIARELHDVIGHNMSMIHVQASSALHRMQKDPAQAQEALTAIKQGSKEGLQELRATLGVLRHVDEEAPTAPSPGLSRIDAPAPAVPERPRAGRPGRRSCEPRPAHPGLLRRGGPYPLNGDLHNAS